MNHRRTKGNEIRRAVHNEVNRYIQHSKFPGLVTQLHVACANNTMPNLIIDLLHQGADVNIESSKGDTPLIFAIRYNRDGMEVIKTLIMHGAKVNTKTKRDHFTPLMLAASKGAVPVMDYLLTNKKDQARIDLKDKCKGTALFYAIKYQQFDAAKYLINKGSDCNVVTSKGNTPLIVATLTTKGKAVTELLLQKRAKIESENQQCDTPILNAIRCGSVPMVIMLLNAHQRKSYVNSPNSNKVTPLMEATKHDNIEIMTILLDYRAAVDKVNNNNETALFYAIRNNSHEALELLDQNGADLRHRNKDYHAPLEVARTLNVKRAIKYLETKLTETPLSSRPGRSSISRLKGERERTFYKDKSTLSDYTLQSASPNKGHGSTISRENSNVSSTNAMKYSRHLSPFILQRSKTEIITRITQAKHENDLERRCDSAKGTITNGKPPINDVSYKTFWYRSKHGGSNVELPVLVVGNKTDDISRDKIKKDVFKEVNGMRKNRSSVAKIKRMKTESEYPTSEFSAYLCKLNLDGQGPDDMFDDKVLYRLTKYIGNKRLNIAIELGISTQEVQELEMDNQAKPSTDIHYFVLKKWKHKKKRPSNMLLFKELVHAFTMADIPNVGEILFQIWKEKYNVK